MSDQQPEERRRERTWLAVGALVGVIVAGLVVGALVVLSGDGEPRPGIRTGANTATSTAAANAGAANATARDDSLHAAEEGAVVLATLDHRTLEEGLTRWESVATAPLVDQLRARRAQTAANVGEAKSASTAKLQAAAVSKLVPDAGTADVLTVLEVTTTDSRGTPTVRQVRQKLTMSNTAEGWKVSVVTPVEPPA